MVSPSVGSPLESRSVEDLDHDDAVLGVVHVVLYYKWRIIEMFNLKIPLSASPPPSRRGPDQPQSSQEDEKAAGLLQVPAPTITEQWPTP
jgi:hypothetical protein